MTRICEHCGKEYLIKKSNQKYCSKKCAKSAGQIRHREKNNKIKYHICEQCGKRFSDQNWSRFCCQECKDAHRHNKSEAICTYCGKPFLINRPQEKYCSDECRHKRAKDAINAIRKTIRVCSICGAEYYASRGQAYCSVDCHKTAVRAARRNRKVTHRHRLDNTTIIDPDISLAKLIARDDNVCHICGRTCDIADIHIIDNKWTATGKDYPSIDHLQPISKGGVHSWANVKLAHKGCNARKSNKTSK